jgi:CubicO group peptidase (beta-lactamase class C family)
MTSSPWLPAWLTAAALLLPARAATPQALPSATVAEINRLVESERIRQHVPALSVAVVRDGRLLLARGYGLANLEHQVPATDSTVYQSGSLGTQFTAALVLQLADSGRVSLDDPIRRFFPEGPARWDSVTVRHLLTHTSGIPDYTDSVVDLHREYTEDQLVKVAAGLPPMFTPGAHWSYSNTGYVLLGALVRRVTGRFYGDLLRERIFAPLGMTTARIISEADIVPHRADGYRLAGDTVKHQEWVSPSLNTTADGSLYLTARDLAAWAIALDDGRALPGADRAAAWTPVRLTDGGSYPYGFGWMLDPVRGRPGIGHTGAWQGFRTSIQRYPDARLTVIVLSNLAEARPYGIGLAVAGIVDRSLVPPHRLGGALPGAASPVPLESVARALTADSASPVLTSGFGRFLTPLEREDWHSLLAGVPSWTGLGCEGGLPPIERFGAELKRWCYARGRGPEGGVALMLGFTADGHLGEAAAYQY